MEMIRVGIWLDDTHFAHALSMGLARACRKMTFTLMNGLEAGEGCDLILTSEELDDPRVVVMVRDEERVNIYGSPPYRVYRYKESHHLINDLLFVYFKITGKNLEFIGDTQCKVLIFASVSGGNGCTATALTVGQMLYKLYGCKCLYLNLCPIDDSKKYLPAGGSSSLLNLLYYLDVEKDFPLGTFITQSNSIDYIHTNMVNSYFDELNLTLLNRLLKKVDEVGTYPFLLIDVSNHLSRNNKQLLAQASRIILLYQGQEFVPETYFSAMTEEIEKIAQGTEIIKVKNFAEEFDADDQFAFVFSRETEGNPSHFQLEAGAIARKIMEDGIHD